MAHTGKPADIRDVPNVAMRAALIDGMSETPDNMGELMDRVRKATDECAQKFLDVINDAQAYDVGKCVSSLDLLQQFKDNAIGGLLLPYGPKNAAGLAEHRKRCRPASQPTEDTE